MVMQVVSRARESVQKVGLGMHEELTVEFLAAAVAVKGALVVEFAAPGKAVDHWPAAGCRAFLTGVSESSDGLFGMEFDLTAFSDHNEMFDVSLSAPRRRRDESSAAYATKRVVSVRGGEVLQGLSVLNDSSLALYREYLDSCMKGYPYLAWLEHELTRVRKEGRRE